MWQIDLENGLSVVGEHNYAWDTRASEPVTLAASQYSGEPICFYTDYIDKSGVLKIQETYDRKKLLLGVYPKLCYVVRTDFLKYAKYDPECYDFADLDFFLKTIEIGTAIHVPVVGFKEIISKKYLCGKETTLDKAAKRLK